MTELVVRRLLIDMEQPVARHWCAGDAFLTAWFNALSMSFPVGEQFFIDSVRDGHKALPADQQERFREEVQAFVGQEATHRRLHALFNAHLAHQGLRNTWEERARERMTLLRGKDIRHAVAMTAANEHFTALYAQWLLSHSDMLDGTEERLKTLWLWHSAEELEHRSTAFNIYLALGGDHAWRVKWMRRATLIFLTDTLRQTVRNLWHDGTLWRPSTWRSAARLLLSKQGVLRASFASWRDYFQDDFHPCQTHSDLSVQWLAHNAGAYTRVATQA